ncbi:hypothetical protein CAC42_562 [Sphaceloma murrayae]|uniref:Helix-turn-helix domain-containing protein n=1 Tax=Sphaceloma murrayae TaxID=2082308 RepID=A0A2K1R3U3_9PEZI|nr:hypothetical protein CAC42_562 [Sphaceloma murrayae]
MGSSASKATRAAGTATRKYPSRPSPSSATTNAPNRPPPPAGATHQPGPTVYPESQATDTRTEAVNLDASDPDFARSLRSLGAVQPNPTLSTSSRFSGVLAGKGGARNPLEATSTEPRGGNAGSNFGEGIRAAAGGPPVGPDPRNNPALMVLKARERIAEEADREAGEMGRRGFQGRRFLDVGTIRQALSLRERGVAEEKVEDMLEVKKGTLRLLGTKGVFRPVEISDI